MKKLKIGDRVQWNEHPQIKSKVDKIKTDRISGELLYHLTNGCKYLSYEITKI